MRARERAALRPSGEQPGRKPQFDRSSASSVDCRLLAIGRLASELRGSSTYSEFCHKCIQYRWGSSRSRVIGCLASAWRFRSSLRSLAFFVVVMRYSPPRARAFTAFFVSVRGGSSTTSKSMGGRAVVLNFVRYFFISGNEAYSEAYFRWVIKRGQRGCWETRRGKNEDVVVGEHRGH